MKFSVIAGSEASGPKENEHAQSEQVLYLVEGQLDAVTFNVYVPPAY